MLAIYTRLSVEDETSNSINNQLREGKFFANDNNYSFEIYNEGMGVSGGAEINNRPVLEKLMNDILQGKIKAVWFRDQNRLERNQLTFHFFVDLVKKNDIKVFIAGKLIDYNDPDTYFKTSLDSLFNAKKRIEQGIGTRRALHDNLKEGKSRGGIMAYGYTKDSNKYVIFDEDEKLVIEDIFDLCLSGKGTKSIATILNNKGIPTRYKKIGEGSIKVKNKYTGRITERKKSETQWAQNTIRSILRNPIYKGEKHFGTGKERKVYKYPVIIDEEKWGDVQETLNRNKVLTGKKVDHKYLLKGILECAVCGRNYYGKVNKNTNIYMCSSKRITKYNCGNRGINISAIEGYIWGRLFMGNGVKKTIQEHIQDGGKEEKTRELFNTLSHYQSELLRLKKERKKAIRLSIEGKIEDEDFEPEIKRIKRQTLDLNIKEKKIKEQLKEFQSAAQKEREIQKDLKNLKSISHNTKKEIIKKYIKRIYVMYTEPIYIISIDYNFPAVETHVIPKDYKIGIIMSTKKAYRLKKDINIEQELEKLHKNIERLSI